MMLATDQMKAYRAREAKYREVNRLILIGNGFDIAHGLKTSFKHFIEDYFHQVLTNIKLEFKHKDPLLSINAYASFEHLNKTISSKEAYKEFRSLIKFPKIEIKKESEFLKTICSEIEAKTWVDIEVIYFKILKESAQREDKIKELNLEMGHIKNLLQKYLIKEFGKNQIPRIPKIQSQFRQKIKIKEVQPNTIIEEKEVSSICVLNFNYTNTPQDYLDGIEGIGSQHIQIHGSLEGDDLTAQGPVFGFGDELDEEYLKFENLENDDLFEHIKSFKYLQFQNYRNLLDFIESKPFQVHVYGHSLGLSDRTLLNTIFENENCISIKLFYHQWDDGNDFEKKTYAISRHFKSKASLRSKVVNKEYSEPMGQAFN